MLSLGKLRAKINEISGKKLKIIILAGSLLLFFCFAAGYFLYYESAKHNFRITFLNVGQGDAALIQFTNGEKMLVDCGPNKIILSALGRNMAFYDRTIDYILTTHPDLDHYGGCIDVVKNYRVKNIITNGKEKQSDPYWQEWNKAMLESGANISIVDKSGSLSIAGDMMQFFSPDPTLSLQPKEVDNNNFSVVFRLIHDGEKFLFTGDMEVPLEKMLVEKYCSSTSACALSSDILKVGHHGSDGSSSELFLSYVKPKTAIISVGKNKYGHPTLRAMRHLERTGAKILRTDLAGDIVIK